MYVQEHPCIVEISMSTFPKKIKISMRVKRFNKFYNIVVFQLGDFYFEAQANSQWCRTLEVI